MVNVSESFKALATANGREISCIITAGDLVFTDNEILSFQFDDVVHNEDMELGTTCANRFHFELSTKKIIPLDAVVKPYVSFKGSNELCPLGVFYISRRYRRRTRYSITCYDRMYRLGEQYKSKLKFPAKMQDVFEELCEKLEITANFGSRSYICSQPPYGCTNRDMIGYIAGANGGCAKFDRYGRLVLKKHRSCGETIRRDNYTDLLIKADEYTVKQIDLVWDDSVYSAGEGTSRTVYRQENPFASELMAQRIYADYAGFTYYGADVKMQALPYLEAGDSVYLQNDYDNGVFNIVISEVVYTYDGTFSAVLSSFSKNSVNEPRKSDEAELLEKALKMQCYTARNDEDAAIRSGAAANLLTLDFKSLSETSLVFGGEIVVVPTEDCQLILRLFLNENEIFPKAMVNLKALEYSTVTLHNFLESVACGVNNLVLTAQISAGICTVQREQALMSVWGQYLSGEGLKNPSRTFAFEMPYFKVSREKVRIDFDEEPYIAAVGVIGKAFSQGFDGFAVSREHIGVGYDVRFADIPYARAAEGGIEIVLGNPADMGETSADAFTIGIPKTGGFDYYKPESAVLSGSNVIFLGFKGISLARGNCSVSYDNSAGTLKNRINGEYIAAFTAEFEVN